MESWSTRCTRQKRSQRSSTWPARKRSKARYCSGTPADTTPSSTRPTPQAFGRAFPAFATSCSTPEGGRTWTSGPHPPHIAPVHHHRKQHTDPWPRAGPEVGSRYPHPDELGTRTHAHRRTQHHHEGMSTYTTQPRSTAQFHVHLGQMCT